MTENSKTILTYGSFDFLHVGHTRLLKRAKQMGTFLIVGLSTDEFNKAKGKTSAQTYEQRKEVLESVKFIDLIIPEETWEQKKRDIEKYNATFVMGSDWEGKFDDLNCVYLPRTEGISSTILKKTL